jgi:hypothetical protein
MRLSSLRSTRTRGARATRRPSAASLRRWAILFVIGAGLCSGCRSTENRAPRSSESKVPSEETPAVLPVEDDHAAAKSETAPHAATTSPAAGDSSNTASDAVAAQDSAAKPSSNAAPVASAAEQTSATQSTSSTESTSATKDKSAAEGSNASSTATEDSTAIAPIANGADADAAPSSYPIHGSLATRYRGRWTTGDHDNDLYAVGQVQFGDTSRDTWTGYFLGEAALDLDGQSPGGGQATFFSLQDTYDSALTGRVYSAYVDYHGASAFSNVRLGRQTIYETPALAWFDGLRVDSRPISDLQLKFGAYGGVAVYPYETFDSENAIGGAYAELKPWKGATARVDWMYLADDKMFGYVASNLIGLALGQTFGPTFRVDGSGTLLDGRGRDYTLKASWTQPEDDLSVQASFYQLVQPQMSLPLQIDPFYATLLTQFPYYQARLMASKGFSDKVGLQAGFDIRRVSDDGDVGEFNRDFEHGFLTATLTNTLPAKLDLSVTSDLWYSGSDDITTWGVDLSRKFGSTWNASIGSYFSLFKYDLFEVSEKNDVRTYYANVRFRQSVLSWDVRYEYEDDPGFGYFQTLRVSALWQF